MALKITWEFGVGILESKVKDISDEELLHKYQKSNKERKKLDRVGLSFVEGSLSTLITIAIFLWILAYFSSVQHNPLTIIGLIFVFIIIWVVIAIVLLLSFTFLETLMGKKAKADYKVEYYRKLIRAKIQPKNIHTECIKRLPIYKNNDTYFKEVNRQIYFDSETDEGNIEQIILPTDYINIRHVQHATSDAEYRFYTQTVKHGLFKNVIIGEFRELYIPY